MGAGSRCAACCSRDRVLKTAKKHHLVIVFAVGIVLAVVWPTPGVWVATKHGGVSPASVLCIVVIFTINGLRLQSRAVRDAAREARSVLAGLLLILFVTVVIGVLATRGLEDEGGFDAVPEVRRAVGASVAPNIAGRR